MKIPFSFGYPGELKTDSNITLHKLVVCMLPGEKQVAVMQKCFTLNDVPCGFYETTDENMRAIEINSLFEPVIRTTRDSCIKITAKRFNNIYTAK